MRMDVKLLVQPLDVLSGDLKKTCDVLLEKSTVAPTGAMVCQLRVQLNVSDRNHCEPLRAV